MTEEGRAIGACNTIFWRKEADGSRKLVGHNTECASETIVSKDLAS